MDVGLRATSPQEILDQIGRHTYTRLGKSRIHGIGVFAIRTIPKGTDPFADGPEYDYVEVPEAMVESLEEPVKLFLKDVCAKENGVYWVPDIGLTGMGQGWYLNHSRRPNMGTEDGDKFIALQDIEVGEELTIDYATFNDDSEVPS